MSPDELLKATHALEEIVEDSPWFREKMESALEAAEVGPWVSHQEVLAEYAMTSAVTN